MSTPPPPGPSGDVDEERRSPRKRRAILEAARTIFLRSGYRGASMDEIAALATAFERLAARGALRVDDPLLAAQHFNWLIMSIPLNRAMLLGDDEPPPAADLDRYADAGVRVFLAAYGTR